MKRRLAAFFTAIVFCFSMFATTVSAAEVNSGSEPDISVIMSSTTEGATEFTTIWVENKGNGAIRFYAKDGEWIDADYSAYGRDIVLYDFNSYLEDVLTKVDYVDVQPEGRAYLLIGVKTSATYYDKNTTIKLFAYYDGAHYETYSSESGGFRYSLMEGSDPALGGHIAGAEVKENVKPATCTAEGSYEAVIYCDFCGDEASRVTKTLPVIPHTEVTDAAVAPSCTSDGLTEGKHCSDCGLVITAQEVIPATGHTAVTDPEVPPTCTDDGMTEGTHCTVCDEVLTPPTIIPATGHNYVDGKCSVCGHVEVTLEAPAVNGSNVASSGKIKLTWNAVENAEKYVVYRSTSKTGTYSKMYTTSKTSYTNTNAKPGKYYYYYVVAVDANGVVSEKSNIAGRTCDYARPAVTASNVASTGKVKLTWSAVEGATSYKVYRSTKENGTYTLMKTVKDGATTYTNTNAVAGKKYYYKVRAYGANSSATSAYSVVDARTCDLPRPVVKITTSSGKPKLSWEKVTGATSYKVYRSTTKDGKYTLMKTVKNCATTYTNTNAVKGKTYYYKVIAVHSNTNANSAYSAVKSIKCTK